MLNFFVGVRGWTSDDDACDGSLNDAADPGGIDPVELWRVYPSGGGDDANRWAGGAGGEKNEGEDRT